MFHHFFSRTYRKLFCKKVVLNKIQDFQESCLAFKIKTRLVYKIQEILSKLKTLENIDELIFYYGHRPKKECFRKMPSPLNITI